MSHSPEPWHPRGCRGGTMIENAEGVRVVRGAGGFTKEEDARRCNAAVNACKGIPTEALEAFAKAGILGGLWRDEWEQAFNAGSDLTTW